MRGRRLAVAVAVVLATVVLGSATTVLISARSRQEKAAEPQVLSQEVRSKKGSANVADTATLGAAGGATDADLVHLKTGSAIRTSSKPTPKPTPVITPQPGRSVPQESVPRDTSRVRSKDAGNSRQYIGNWVVTFRSLFRNAIQPASHKNSRVTRCERNLRKRLLPPEF